MNPSTLYEKIKAYDKVIILVLSIVFSIGGGKLMPDSNKEDISELKTHHEEQKARMEALNSKLSSYQNQIDSLKILYISLQKSRDSMQVVVYFLEKKNGK